MRNRKRKERRERKGGGDYTPRRKGGGEYDPRRKGGEEYRTNGLRIQFHSTGATKKT
jgi:hypothetical protein